jgi:hypothetical protein
MAAGKSKSRAHERTVAMDAKDRQFVLPLAELVDRLTIDQIKDVLFTEGRAAINEEMKRIQHDVDLIIGQKAITLDAKLIRVIVAIAQINLHIWNNKDLMDACKESDPEKYLRLLKFAHQLNGVRNQLKNQLLVVGGEKDAASVRSNFKTDGLQGWNIEI